MVAVSTIETGAASSRAMCGIWLMEVMKAVRTANANSRHLPGNQSYVQQSINIASLSFGVMRSMRTFAVWCKWHPPKPSCRASSPATVVMFDVKPALHHMASRGAEPSTSADACTACLYAGVFVSGVARYVLDVCVCVRAPVCMVDELSWLCVLLEI